MMNRRLARKNMRDGFALLFLLIALVAAAFTYAAIFRVFVG